MPKVKEEEEPPPKRISLEPDGKRGSHLNDSEWEESDEESSGQGLKKNAVEKEKKKKEESDPVATVAQVFSFAQTPANKVCIAVGLFFAAVTGCTFPAMAWIFASSFEKLSSFGVEG